MYWIAIEDINGTRYGNGPIITATSWTYAPRLDRAGQFLFAMPAADPRAADVQPKRVAHCYVVDRNGLQDMGAGVIDEITVSASNEGTLLNVSGPDLLSELTRRTCGDLLLKETTIEHPSECQYRNEWGDHPWSFVDMTEAVDGSVGDTGTFVATSDPEGIIFGAGENNYFGHYVVYVRHDVAFTGLDFTLVYANAHTDITWELEYWNTESQDWDGLSFEDTTIGANGATFGQSGRWSWEAPSGWGIAEDATYYEVRFFVSAGENYNIPSGDPNVPPTSAADASDAVGFSDIAVVYDEPTYTALENVMSKAPEGWYVDASQGYATMTPAAGIMAELAGESVLEALVLLTEQSGQHFIKSPSGRLVQWLGKDQRHSGIIAIGGAYSLGNSSTASMCFIADGGLTQIHDGGELASRIYPTGGGTGAGRVSLVDCTRTPAAGYTLDKTNNCLIRDGAEATGPRIDNVQSFPDVNSIGMSKTAREEASNQLYDRAYEWLRTHSATVFDRADVAYDVPTAYRLRVLGLNQVLLPGYLLRVRYRERRGSYTVLDIDKDLWIIASTVRVDNNGIATTDLEVATIDRQFMSEAEWVAQELRKARYQRNRQAGQGGHVSQTAGIPYTITIDGGQVSSIGKIRPVADGTYTSVYVRKGVIVDGTT